MLARLLACTPSLKTLDYESIVMVRGAFNCAEMSDALAHVKDTLEHFGWIFHERPLGSDCSINGRCHIRHLRSLKSLCISPRTLLGEHKTSDIVLAEALPTGLEELCLTTNENNMLISEWRAEEIMPAVTDFVEGERWRELTPDLMSLYMADLAGDDPLKWQFKHKLEDLCERNGLKYAPGRTWDAS
jgi:hypothetical protein